MSRSGYRPEIDGLRAVAVLPVMFYHANLRFPGGYVGVDVFFVISGFLITSVILHEMATGTFTLRNFWVRRIRRIMPAAAVTVLVSLLAGYFILLPAHFRELGHSALAQSLMAANIYFYRESGYFAAAVQSKPLLHFWSLAVEEQFYLLFPFLLLVFQRWRAGFGFVAGLALISFAASIVGIEKFPEATFYLLPTRAWELALGSLLALRGGELPLPANSRKLCGWVGTGLIIVPMFFYTNKTPFPGMAALPPCVGTLLVIWSTADNTGLLARLLSWKPVVFVGLLSYSLYLWHWPVMVFVHYWLPKFLSPLPVRLSVIALSFALAWVSWRYVEIPFRVKRNKATGRAPLAFALMGTAAAGAIGLWVLRANGLPDRFPSNVARYSAAYDDHPRMEDADLTVEQAEAGRLVALNEAAGTGAPSVVLWGDSHARAATGAVETMCKSKGVAGFRASRSGTAGLLNYGDADARRYNQAVFRCIEKQRPTWVVLASRWEVVLALPQDEEILRKTVQKLQAVGVHVAIMRQVAAQGTDVPKALARAALTAEPVSTVGVTVEEHARHTHRSNEIIDHVARSLPGLRTLDPIPLLSRDGRCLAEDSGFALYYDNQHLTHHGAHLLTPLFGSLFPSATGFTERSVGSIFSAESRPRP